MDVRIQCLNPSHCTCSCVCKRVFMREVAEMIAMDISTRIIGKLYDKGEKMPYLTQGERASLDDGRKALKGGDLNYQISKLLNDFVAMKQLNYAAINEAMGALECAKLEFYRRVASNYEDLKAKQNGEVYTCLKVD